MKLSVARRTPVRLGSRRGWLGSPLNTRAASPPRPARLQPCAIPRQFSWTRHYVHGTTRRATRTPGQRKGVAERAAELSEMPSAGRSRAGPGWQREARQCACVTPPAHAAASRDARRRGAGRVQVGRVRMRSTWRRCIAARSLNRTDARGPPCTAAPVSARVEHAAALDVAA